MIYLSLVKYVVHKFLTGICVVSIINCLFTKKSLIQLSSLCKLYHETIAIILTNINKGIVESLWDGNLTQGTTKNIPWAFVQEYTHLLIETSSSGSCNS